MNGSVRSMTTTLPGGPLHPDETILWTGQPDIGRYIRDRTLPPVILFSLIVAFSGLMIYSRPPQKPEPPTDYSFAAFLLLLPTLMAFAGIVCNREEARTV